MWATARTSAAPSVNLDMAFRLTHHCSPLLNLSLTIAQPAVLASIQLLNRNLLAWEGDKWAYSSTGVFLGNDKADYVATNQFYLNISGPDYFKTARMAPLYLNYYGLCMLNNNYKVKLHFAEIAFSDDQSYSSLGKHVFDVSIQIATRAGGLSAIIVVGMAVIGIAVLYATFYVWLDVEPPGSMKAHTDGILSRNRKMQIVLVLEEAACDASIVLYQFF
ncbi:putative LRR receptor-like serine/threonine-protein kinase [Glycine soja]